MDNAGGNRFWVARTVQPMDNQLLATEDGERSRPGLKSTPSVTDLSRSPVEVDTSVLSTENGSIRCELLILRSRKEVSRFQTSEGLYHQRSPHLSKVFVDIFRCL